MMRMGRVVGLLAVALSLASCVIVHDEPEGRSRRPVVTSSPRLAGFSARERRIIEAYLAETSRHDGCPPGLAKKRNGCQPPGQAKKRYVTGRPLPRDVLVRPLPRDLEIRIGRPPRGCIYAVVDGDVVKLVVGSLLVIDAISGIGS